MSARDESQSKLNLFVGRSDNIESGGRSWGDKQSEHRGQKSYAVQRTRRLSSTDQFESKRQYRDGRGNIWTHFTFDMKEDKTMCTFALWKNCGAKILTKSTVILLD